MELLEPGDAFWQALERGDSDAELAKAVPDSFTTMREDGYRQIMEGTTTLSEINRVMTH